LFIKTWLPELINVPVNLLHEPWKLTPMEQELYQIKIGKDYPTPIVDIEESRKKASEIIWGIRKTDVAKKEGRKILKKHVNQSSKFTSKRK
jgi:deoxyribodipyrimidine photo-lyase